MDSDHIYTVIDVPSLEVMQNLMKEPQMIKLRENAGVISETQEMVTIQLDGEHILIIVVKV